MDGPWTAYQQQATAAPWTAYQPPNPSAAAHATAPVSGQAQPVAPLPQMPVVPLNDAQKAILKSLAWDTDTNAYATALAGIQSPDAVARQSLQGWAGTLQGVTPETRAAVGSNPDVARALLAQQFAPKTTTVKEGEKVYSTATGQLLFDGSGKKTGDMKEYEAYTADQMRRGLPVATYNDWDLQRRRATVPNTENRFDQEVGAKQADLMSSLYNEGLQGRTDLATTQQLRQAIAKTPGGTLGGFQNLASQWGVKVGPGVSETEAASSLISKLVPQQRQGMPGAASDRDVAMFRDALPKLSNTPEGNALILDTIEALAQQRVMRGEIATRVYTGQMDRRTALDALQALPDPFARLRAALPQQPAARAPVASPALSGGKGDRMPIGSDGWTTLPNGMRIREVR